MTIKKIVYTLKVKTLYLLFIALASVTASAFPTMVAKGYLACATCHVSAIGGGLLTPYGSGAARDILSFSDSNALKKPTIAEWINYGGSMRVLQTRANAKGYTFKKFTLMQADLEVAVGNEKIKAVGTIGYQNPGSQSYQTGDSEIFSRRHYAQFVLHPNLALQAGRLNAPYGPEFAEHQTLQKSALGFGEGSESYQVQATYSSDGLQGTTAIGKDKNRGAFSSTRLINQITDTYLIGYNTYFDTTGRVITGPEGVIIISPRLIGFLNFDFDIPKKGALELITTARISYELKKGIHLFTIGERATGDIISLTSGVNLYPVEHFQIQLAVQVSQFNVVWLMGHMWL